MRARNIRVLVLFAVVFLSLSLSAAPNQGRERSGGKARDESAIMKIVKAVRRGVASLGDSLVVPHP